MLAIAIGKHGPPSVLEERVVEDRRLLPQDVRIAVGAAGVNFADLMGRVGLYPDAPPLPYVPGYEVAGTIVEAGPRAIERLPPGTRVMATTRFGGYAERVRVPEHAVVPIAPHVSFAAAAATPVVYLTAWLALVKMAAVQPGEVVLVHGGAGGVGLAALDISREFNVEMHATAGGPEKCKRLLAMGIVRAIDHQCEDVEKVGRAATRGRGYDVVLDPLGPESFQRSLRMLAPLGRLVCYGFSNLVTGTKRNLWHAATRYLGAAKVNPIALMNQNASVSGLNLAHLFGEKALHRDGMRRLGEMLDNGRIKPLVDARFPFTATGAAAAHQHLHDRKNFGKVVLERETM